MVGGAAVNHPLRKLLKRCEAFWRIMDPRNNASDQERVKAAEEMATAWSRVVELVEELELEARLGSVPAHAVPGERARREQDRRWDGYRPPPPPTPAYAGGNPFAGGAWAPNERARPNERDPMDPNPPPPPHYRSFWDS